MWRRVLAPVLLGLASGAVVTGAATYHGLWFPSSLQGRWFFTFPVLGSDELARWQASAIYIGGLILLGLAWVWLLRVVRAERRFPAWSVLVVFALWSVPFLVGPPVSSDDVVTYAAVGRLVERGLDPYEVGVVALGSDPVVAASSPTWRDSPTPYGPLYIEVAQAATALTPGSFRATVIVLRLFGFTCLALLALPLAFLARRAGTTPAFAFTAVLCSPLVLVQLVGAAHNETLMILLLAGGVALGLTGLPGPGRERRLLPVAMGVVLCGLGTAVKLPALLGAVLLGWLWSGSETPVLRRLVDAAAGGMLAATVLVAVSLGSGLGLGWVGALDVPQQVHTALAPFTAFGVVVRQVLLRLGWPSDWVVPVFRPAGMLVGMVVAGALLWRADRLGGPMALGLALMALAWTTPAVWPWYMTWGLVFVGTVTMPVALQAVIIGVNLVLTPLGPGALDVNGRPNASATFIALLFLVAAAIAFRRTVWGPSGALRTTVPTGGPGADVINA